MGYSNYSDEFYKARAVAREATGTPTFTYDADIRAGKVKSGVHASLNIRGKIRESRDSKEHPNSTPIGIIFDETGSMAEVPKIMQGKLPKSHGAPALARGTSRTRRCSSARSATSPTANQRRSRSGSSSPASRWTTTSRTSTSKATAAAPTRSRYQNALYYFAHKTSCDAFEKRGKKGYLLLIGDEMAYPRSTKDELRRAHRRRRPGRRARSTRSSRRSKRSGRSSSSSRRGPTTSAIPSSRSSGRSISARTSSSSRTPRRSARPSA